jgi:hypothetical protein
VKLDTHFNQLSDLAHWGTPCGNALIFHWCHLGFPAVLKLIKAETAGIGHSLQVQPTKKNAIETEKMD